MLNYQYINNNHQENIVLLHGFCENISIFNNQTAFLKNHFNVLCIDLPGFGRSETIDNITIPIMANEVRSVLKNLNINHCFLFGHSMGGYVTLAFAKEFAFYLKGFGLLHSTAKKDSFERLNKRKQLINFIKKNGVALFYKSFFPDLFFDKITYKTTIDTLIESSINDKKNGVIEAIKAMMMREANLKLLEEIDSPVFFAVGKYDNIITDLDMLGQAAICKEAEICYLKNSNHMGMIEEPAILNEAILNFVKRVSTNSKSLN